MIYTRYFIINLVVEGFYSWLPEKKQVTRLSYIILEEKERDVLGDDEYFYIYTGICFEGTLIKKLLSTKNVCRLITSTRRSHIKISRCVCIPLTNEKVLNMVKDNILHSLIPVSIKSKLYSYNI